MNFFQKKQLTILATGLFFVSGCSLSLSAVDGRLVPKNTITETSTVLELSQTATVSELPQLQSMPVTTTLLFPDRQQDVNLPTSGDTSSSRVTDDVFLNATSSIKTLGVEKKFRNTYFSLRYPSALHFEESASTTGLSLSWNKSTYVGIEGSVPLGVEMNFSVTTETKHDCVRNYTETVAYLENSSYAENSGFSAEILSKYGVRWYRSYSSGAGLGSSEDYTYYELPTGSFCYRLEMKRHFVNHFPDSTPTSTIEQIKRDTSILTNFFEKILESFEMSTK
jgi:hypothetical protein